MQSKESTRSDHKTLAGLRHKEVLLGYAKLMRAKRASSGAPGPDSSPGGFQREQRFFLGGEANVACQDYPKL